MKWSMAKFQGLVLTNLPRQLQIPLLPLLNQKWDSGQLMEVEQVSLYHALSWDISWMIQSTRAQQKKSWTLFSSFWQLVWWAFALLTRIALLWLKACRSKKTNSCRDACAWSRKQCLNCVQYRSLLNLPLLCRLSILSFNSSSISKELS